MARTRPARVTVFTVLLILGAAFMAWLGSMAAGYYVPAAVLLIQAALLWTGAGRGLFSLILLINQASGLILILVLWLGGALGDAKLDISGGALLVNLATGGPLMAILAIPLWTTARAAVPRAA